MRGMYQRLLGLYPKRHREDFGEEMAGVFRDLKDDVKGKGLAFEMQFYAREGIGGLCGAAAGALA
jgi:hypothetical protein